MRREIERKKRIEIVGQGRGKMEKAEGKEGGLKCEKVNDNEEENSRHFSIGIS